MCWTEFSFHTTKTAVDTGECLEDCFLVKQVPHGGRTYFFIEIIK